MALVVAALAAVVFVLPNLTIRDEVTMSTPFSGGNDCLDIVEVELQEPLGERSIVDLHSGQHVELSQ